MSPLDKSTHREFMVTTSSAALGAAVPLAGTQRTHQSRIHCRFSLMRRLWHFHSALIVNV